MHWNSEGSSRSARKTQLLDATLVNIRIKLILSEHLHFCRW